MKKFRVIRNGIETNAWTSDFAGKDYYEPGFGKPQREVKDATDEEKATALSSREVVDERTGETVTMYLLPAEFVVVEEDIAEQLATEKARAEALAYLASTDWMVIREMDAGTPMPEDVRQKRADARSKV